MQVTEAMIAIANEEWVEERCERCNRRKRFKGLLPTNKSYGIWECPVCQSRTFAPLSNGQHETTPTDSKEDQNKGSDQSPQLTKGVVPRPTEDAVILRELAEHLRAEREQQRIQKLYQQWEKLWQEGKTNQSWEEWFEERQWYRELYLVWEDLVNRGETDLSWQSWIRKQRRRRCRQ